MPHFDIFNGDADGICAIHQIRLHNPQKSTLVTGVKRDTLLLKNVISVKNSVLTVLDISSHANREPLLQLLKQGNTIHYFDHHFSGEIPESPLFHPHIDTSSDVCTSIIVDRFLKGEHRYWAIVASFGDNLHSSALKLADSLNLDTKETEELREMGELINYNSYGETKEDLYYSPEFLYRAIHPYSDPLEFFHSSGELVKLREGFLNDMELAEAIVLERNSKAGRIFIFPNEAWCRRVCGTFINKLAREETDLAHSLLVERQDGSFQVSVRAPLSKPYGAEKLCIKFAGGGRAMAAGINDLAPEEVEPFYEAFEKQFVS